MKIDPINYHKLIVLLILWFMFSASTLFMNKYIVSYQNGDPLFLGIVQLLCCTITSYAYLKFRQYFHLNRTFSKTKIGDNHQDHSINDNDDDKLHHQHSQQYFNMNYLFIYPFKFALIGLFRLTTILLGLIALWYIPVSFAEMIKSSAPIFTMIISLIIMQNETIRCQQVLTLIPIMTGLALCSAYEIQFNFYGFLLAIAANLSECMQNVLSKKFIQDNRSININQIQLFTSVFTIVFQLPYFYYYFIIFDEHSTNNNNLDDHQSSITTTSRTSTTFVNYLLCGLSYHLQTLTEYGLLNIISPISHSVANTVKRALLIWLSVLIFNNPVTVMSWIGTLMVIAGVIFYNRSLHQHYQHHQQQQQQLLVNNDESMLAKSIV